VIDPTTSAFYIGECRSLLRRLPAGCVQMCVTSPPYWGLRSYLDDDDPMKRLEVGAEDTPEEYVAHLVEVFAQVWRVLRDDGTLWLNLGDCYQSKPRGEAGEGASTLEGTSNAKRRRLTKGVDPKNPRVGARDNNAPNRRRQKGLKNKYLIGLPWRTAFALRDWGWYLRQDNIWSKPNPMPESVTDRTTRSHEYLFHFSKSETYYYDADAIAEPATRGAAGSKFNTGKTAIHQLGRSSGKEREERDERNKRSVWTVTPKPYEGAHFAVFPADLIEPCILACSRVGDLVLDPFFGSGTTGEVAEKHERRWIGFDLNPKYAELAKERTAQRSLPLSR
jgi:DNA modification methylase